MGEEGHILKLCESAHLRVSSEGSKSVEKASKRNKMEKANIRSEANIQFLLMQDNFSSLVSSAGERNQIKIAKNTDIKKK